MNQACNRAVHANGQLRELHSDFCGNTPVAAGTRFAVRIKPWDKEFERMLTPAVTGDLSSMKTLSEPFRRGPVSFGPDC